MAGAEAQWRVRALTRDEEDIAFYVTAYKAFRLLALQTDPSGE